MTSKKDRELRAKRKQQEKRKQQMTTILILVAVFVMVGGFIGLRQLPSIKYNLGEIIYPDPIDEMHLNGIFIGDDAAPIKIQEFSAYNCSHCRNFALEDEDYFIQNYVDTGIAQIEFVPVSYLDSSLMLLEKGNYCASDQGQFYQYRDMVFANQSNSAYYPYTDESVMAFAAALDLNLKEFRSCYESDKYDNQILTNYQYVTSLDLSGTPTFIINGDIENQVIGGNPYTLEETIQGFIE